LLLATLKVPTGFLGVTGSLRLRAKANTACVHAQENAFPIRFSTNELAASITRP
jgi:hypothetical protein